MSDFWVEYWQQRGQKLGDADMCVQVGRTINSQPLADDEIAAILEDIESKIELRADDEVLEMCCGNGIITRHLAPQCRQIVANDVSCELLAKIDFAEFPNVVPLEQDARLLSFPDESFDKVLLYAGLQYFSERETIVLFRSVMNWLRRGGVFLVGDIPNRDRIWNYFCRDQWRDAYFRGLEAGQPIIGSWFGPSWFEKLGQYLGCQDIEALPQHHSMPFAHYRFDVKLKKIRM